MYLLDRQQQQQQQRCNKLQYARGLPAPHLLLQHQFLLLLSLLLLLLWMLPAQRHQDTQATDYIGSKLLPGFRFASSSRLQLQHRQRDRVRVRVLCSLCTFSSRLRLGLGLVLGERLWQSAISRYVNFMLTNQFEI